MIACNEKKHARDSLQRKKTCPVYFTSMVLRKEIHSYRRSQQKLFLINFGKFIGKHAWRLQNVTSHILVKLQVNSFSTKHLRIAAYFYRYNNVFLECSGAKQKWLSSWSHGFHKIALKNITKMLREKINCGIFCSKTTKGKPFHYFMYFVVLEI